MLKRCSNLKTIRDLIRFCTSFFEASKISFGQGTNNAFDEAIFIIFSYLKLPFDQSEIFLDSKLTSKEIDALYNIFDRRVSERLPAAYLLREAWQFDYKFYVDERVIIPRSLIAEFLVKGLEPWVDDAQNVKNVLDLCCGSACLSIIASKNFPNAEIDAVDLSKEALQVAKINLEMYGLQKKVKIHHGDLFSALPKNSKFDVIITNPPYVSPKKMASLPPEFKAEPSLSLCSEKDGISHISRIINLAESFLKDHGLIFIEIGGLADLMEKKFKKLPFIFLDNKHHSKKVILLQKDDLVRMNSTD